MKEYLEFQEMDGWYDIYNKRTKELLGYIEFDEKWKKFVSVTKKDYEIKFCEMCHKQIYEFLHNLNKKRK